MVHLLDIHILDSPRPGMVAFSPIGPPFDRIAFFAPEHCASSALPEEPAQRCVHVLSTLMQRRSIPLLPLLSWLFRNHKSSHNYGRRGSYLGTLRYLAGHRSLTSEPLERLRHPR